MHEILNEPQTRRRLLRLVATAPALTIASPSLRAQPREAEGPTAPPSTAADETTFEDVWQMVRDRSYDPGLHGHCSLIGFAGAPFTVACYMVEGGGSRDFAATRTMAYAEPVQFGQLMELLTEATVRYVSAQIAAGSTSPSLRVTANNHRPQIPRNTAEFLTNGATSPRTRGDRDKVAGRPGFEPAISVSVSIILCIQTSGDEYILPVRAPSHSRPLSATFADPRPCGVQSNRASARPVSPRSDRAPVNPPVPATPIHCAQMRPG